jgi:hypothetical protein
MILNAVTLVLCALIAAGGSVWAAWITRRVREVHVLVNQQLDTVMNKNVELTAQLKTANEEGTDQ